MAQSTLRTRRLTLVPLADEHLDLEVALDADPEVMRYLTGRGHSRAEVQRSHRRRRAVAEEVPGLGFWVGFAEDGFVGWWLLLPPDGPGRTRAPDVAELGYRLLRGRWRRGYGVEGARELVRHGFDDLGLDRVFAQAMALNAASRATMAAAGLSFAREFSGAGHGEVEYEVTRAAWRQRRDHPGG